VSSARCKATDGGWTALTHDKSVSPGDDVIHVQTSLLQICALMKYNSVLDAHCLEHVTLYGQNEQDMKYSCVQTLCDVLGAY
jgi:hypothetical protein